MCTFECKAGQFNAEEKVFLHILLSEMCSSAEQRKMATGPLLNRDMSLIIATLCGTTVDFKREQSRCFL